MRSGIFTLYLKIPEAASPHFESAKVMFFAQRLATARTGDFPTKTPITVLAQTSRTCLGLKFQTVLS
jgi:hypothetical protein